MILLAAIVLAILVVPSPWEAPVIAAGGVWEAAEAVFWIRWSQRRRAYVGAEALLGKTATVVDRLDPAGRVRVSGELWTGRTTTAQPVEPGAEVRILALEGLVLDVEPLSPPSA
jgi:membrane protein implicated in regulation of membrane protease activity